MAVDPAIVSRLQLELLVQIRPERTVRETLQRVLPLVVDRLGATSIHVFAHEFPSRAKHLYGFPHATRVTDQAMEAALSSLRAHHWVRVDQPSPTGSLFAWGIAGLGSIVLIAGDRHPPEVVSALRTVFEALAQVVQVVERTERLAARAELAERQARDVQRRIDMIPECVVQLDAGGSVTAASAAWSLLCGEPAHQALGRDLRTYLAPSLRLGQHVRAIEDVLNGRTQACWLQPLAWLGKAGRTVVVRVALEGYRDEAGTVLGAVGSIIETGEVVEPGPEVTVEPDAGVGEPLAMRPSRPSEPSARPVGRDAIGPRPTVIVADDNATNAMVLSAMLEHLGLRPVEVCDGSDVLAAVESQAPIAVFMDIQMPELDGVEAKIGRAHV